MLIFKTFFLCKQSPCSVITNDCKVMKNHRNELSKNSDAFYMARDLHLFLYLY